MHPGAAFPQGPLCICIHPFLPLWPSCLLLLLRGMMPWPACITVEMVLSRWWAVPGVWRPKNLCSCSQSPINSKQAAFFLMKVKSWGKEQICPDFSQNTCNYDQSGNATHQMQLTNGQWISCFYIRAVIKLPLRRECYLVWSHSGFRIYSGQTPT